MKTKVGLWIDHRKAIIVAVTDKGEEIRLIISKVERQLRRSGDSPLEGAYDKAQGRDTSPDGDVLMEHILENMNTTPPEEVLKRIPSLPPNRQGKVLDIRR